MRHLETWAAEVAIAEEMGQKPGLIGSLHLEKKPIVPRNGIEIYSSKDVENFYSTNRTQQRGGLENVEAKGPEVICGPCTT